MIILLNGTAVWVTQCAQQSDCWPIRQLFWLHFNPVAYLAKYGKVMKSTPSKKTIASIFVLTRLLGVHTQAVSQHILGCEWLMPAVAAEKL